jgi:hypothetical protein
MPLPMHGHPSPFKDPSKNTILQFDLSGRMDTASDLSPVAGHPDISPPAVAPMTRNPTCIGARRRCIPARYPNIATAIPAVISGLPNPAAMHRCRDNFPRRRWRRSDMDIYLGRGHQTRCEYGGGYEDKKPFFHHSSSDRLSAFMRSARKLRTRAVAKAHGFLNTEAR